MYKYLPLMVLTLVACPAVVSADPIEKYAGLVYESYTESLVTAQQMRAVVDRFLDQPNAASLEDARAAWLSARTPYGHTEAFRFYEGPIDYVSPDGSDEGPEGLINAWPVNEAALDAIIADRSIAITPTMLVEKNQADDEADVTTGYHAIEYLLWGKDLSLDGPGDRAYTDFLPGDDLNERRRLALRVLSDLLVDDLVGLVNAWAPNVSDNYRAAFVAMDRKEALGKILTGVATLAGFELASERIAVPLDSGDQEDEHSCFSDNTHKDFVANAVSIEWVLTKTGLIDWIAKTDSSLAKSIEATAVEAVNIAGLVEPPVDRILASKPGSVGRLELETLVKSLQSQAKMLEKAGKKLGVEVVVAGE